MDISLVLIRNRIIDKFKNEKSIEIRSNIDFSNVTPYFYIRYIQKMTNFYVSLFRLRRNPHCLKQNIHHI